MIYSVEIDSAWIYFDKQPDSCTRCLNSGDFELIEATYIISTRSFVEIAFKCSNTSCNRFLIGGYQKSSVTDTYCLQYVTPSPRPRPSEISKEARAISPLFTEIYGQALAAEHHKLEQVAGVAYRKAFEFLIKDYCIDSNSDDAESIKQMALSQVIDNYIGHQALKECARRAAWLGNDETHYVRKWEDRDIKDLKKLIEMVCQFISFEQCTAKYTIGMPQKPK